MLVAGQDTKQGLPDWSGAPVTAPVGAAATVCVAEEMGLLAEKALRDGAAGRVVAVFERSFYATLDGIWICVGQTGIGSGPLHLLGDFRWRRLVVGDAVQVTNSVLWVANAPFATLTSASVWRPNVAPRWSAISLQRGLGAVDKIWSGGLIAGGLAILGSSRPPRDPSTLVRAAMPGVLALQNLLAGAEDNSDQIFGLNGLIGLGPGLTPSGDDLIAGALIALAALGCVERRDALWTHYGALLDATNEISRIHLQAAAQGHGAAALHTAISATMSGETAQVHPAVNALTTIGHTSGLDAFAGSLIVLRHALRKQ